MKLLASFDNYNRSRNKNTQLKSLLKYLSSSSKADFLRISDVSEKLNLLFELKNYRRLTFQKKGMKIQTAVIVRKACKNRPIENFNVNVIPSKIYSG